MKETMKTILVDSRDRVDGTTSDFWVKLPRPLHRVTQIDLRQLVISEGIFNINDTNGLFLFTANTFSKAFPQTAGYIAAGYYTPSQFAFALQTAIAEVLATDSNWKPEPVPYITTGVNNVRQLELYGRDADLSFTIEFPNLTAATTFGFPSLTGWASTPTTDIDGNVYQYITSVNPMGLEVLEYLCLQSAELGGTVETARGVPVYDVIPIPDRVRPLVYTRYEAPRKSARAPTTLNELHLKLVKPKGTVIDLRGCDVALVLEVVQLIDE